LNKDVAADTPHGQADGDVELLPEVAADALRGDAPGDVQPPLEESALLEGDTKVLAKDADGVPLLAAVPLQPKARDDAQHLHNGHGSRVILTGQMARLWNKLIAK